MAWIMDSCELEIDGAVNREEEDGQNFFHVRDLCLKEVNDVVFYGRIKDGNDNGLEGALLKIFAVRKDGSEVPLNHFYSGKNGYYLVNIPKPEFSVAKYIIRTSKSSLPPVGNQSQAWRQRVSGRVQLPMEVDNIIEMTGE
ncbi:MAG: hypothetical protein ACOY31_02610 [Bacillota bacterium]